MLFLVTTIFQHFDRFLIYFENNWGIFLRPLRLLGLLRLIHRIDLHESINNLEKSSLLLVLKR